MKILVGLIECKGLNLEEEMQEPLRSEAIAHANTKVCLHLHWTQNYTSEDNRGDGRVLVGTKGKLASYPLEGPQ